MRELVLIWGAGGHGKVVADLVRAAGHAVAGYADADQAKWGAVVEPGGATVVISEADLVQLLDQGGSLPCRATAIALALGDNDTRLRSARRAARALMPALVHPAATVSESAQLGRGTVVFAGAVVNAAATIGSAAIINTSAVIEHDCTIGDGAHIAPGAVLTGGVNVGQVTLVGARAVVLPGVTIEADALIGAGSVVAGDVKTGMVVAGVPARVLRQRPT
ncbi:MAG TPA: NeuD/PglB/VioB family sugar acetyltransferase [Gemmatimonadaceae bacterium]|nr:NeuD/PglB/VioB family sugar acetyltransferase [Gemmatimonadaceae bacterium]